jgi:hypothetical protein
VSGKIDITDAYLRFDEHGTCHTDAKVFAERIHLDATAWHGGPRWLCVHEKGNPECPPVDGEWLIAGYGGVAWIGFSPPSTSTEKGSR